MCWLVYYIPINPHEIPWYRHFIWITLYNHFQQIQVLVGEITINKFHWQICCIPMKAAFLLLCNHIHHNYPRKSSWTSPPQKNTCNPHQTTIKLPFKITIFTISPSNPHQNPAGFPVKKIDTHLFCQLSHGLRLQQQVITIPGEAVQAPQATIQGLVRSGVAQPWRCMAENWVHWWVYGWFMGIYSESMGFPWDLWGFVVNLWDFHGMYGWVMISWFSSQGEVYGVW